MATVAAIHSAYRWASRLYRLAGTWTEKIALTSFFVKLVLARLMPRLRQQEDVALSLQGTTYIVGLKSTEIYTLEELYDDHDYDRAYDFIPEAGWIVFDIGANVGMFAMQQAHRGAQVYAFEPNPDCYRRLSRAIVENHLIGEITAFNYAIGSMVGLGMMRLQADQTTAGSVIRIDNTYSTTGCPIKITSLNLLVPALGVSHIDLLKIDVEGAEVDVLNGTTRMLSLVDRIVLEYHSSDLREQVCTFLSDHGFTQTLHLETVPQIGVGLLYARRSITAV